MSSSNKPSYLGTLNASVNGERRGFEFLNTWAIKTKNTSIAKQANEQEIQSTSRQVT